MFAPPGGWVGVCTGAVTVVWRVVVVVASGELAQDTSIKTKTESAEPSMIALFISKDCLFNKRFLAGRFSFKWRIRHNVVIIRHAFPSCHDRAGVPAVCAERERRCASQGAHAPRGAVILAHQTGAAILWVSGLGVELAEGGTRGTPE
jgi:hypothetical protein